MLLPFPFLPQREHSWRNVSLTSQESKYSSKGKMSCTWISRRHFQRQTHNQPVRFKCSSYKCIPYKVSRLPSLWLGTQGRKQLAAESCWSVTNWRGVSRPQPRGWLPLKHTEATGLLKCFTGSLFNFPYGTGVPPFLPEGGTSCSALAEVRIGSSRTYSLWWGTAQCLNTVLEIAYVKHVPLSRGIFRKM